MSESTFQEEYLATITHGRFLLTGSKEEGSPLLVGFHGYGENAGHHLEKLVQIPGAESWRLCAVEALHPFYTRQGDVVASWMTKQGRERAIDDNIRYAAAVVAELKRRFGPPRKLVYSGFSQGVAMAWRATVRAGHPCHGLVALAGDVPPEVAASEHASLPPVLLGRGLADSWYDGKKMSADLEVLQRLGVEVTECVFEGGHDWTAEFFAAAGEFLRRVEDHKRMR